MTGMTTQDEGLRDVAGSLIKGEIKRNGWTNREAAARMSIAASTLDRIYNGDPSVKEFTYVAVEGALGMPRGLLAYVIAGDIEEIETLDSLEPDLRRHVIGVLRRAKDLRR